MRVGSGATVTPVTITEGWREKAKKLKINILQLVRQRKQAVDLKRVNQEGKDRNKKKNISKEKKRRRMTAARREVLGNQKKRLHRQKLMDKGSGGSPWGDPILREPEQPCPAMVGGRVTKVSSQPLSVSQKEDYKTIGKRSGTKVLLTDERCSKKENQRISAQQREEREERNQRGGEGQEAT